MSFVIQADRRDGKAEELRAAGRVPAVMYGAGITPVSLSVSSVDFEKLHKNAGESTLVDLVLDNAAPVKVLIQDVDFDILKGKAVHVDFKQIDMTKELEVEVEIVLVGLAPAVKALGGSLVQQLESVNVKCLPKDLMNNIQVDVTGLETFDDAIHVGDLKFPAGVVALDDAEALVAKVIAPMTEDELKAMEGAAAVDVSKIEVEKKGKKEDPDAEEKK